MYCILAEWNYLTPNSWMVMQLGKTESVICTCAYECLVAMHDSNKTVISAPCCFFFLFTTLKTILQCFRLQPIRLLLLIFNNSLPVVCALCFFIRSEFGLNWIVGMLLGQFYLKLYLSLLSCTAGSTLQCKPFIKRRDCFRLWSVS